MQNNSGSILIRHDEMPYKNILGGSNPGLIHHVVYNGVIKGVVETVFKGPNDSGTLGINEILQVKVLDYVAHILSFHPYSSPDHGQLDKRYRNIGIIVMGIVLNDLYQYNVPYVYLATGTKNYKMRNILRIFRFSEDKKTGYFYKKLI